MNLKRKRQGGFSLIEILTVIAIISILATVIFANLNEARKRARDAVRLRDLKEIAHAADLYYLEHPGEQLPVPITGYFDSIPIRRVTSLDTASWNTFLATLGLNPRLDPLNGKTLESVKNPRSMYTNYQTHAYTFTISITGYGVSDANAPLICTPLEVKPTASTPVCESVFGPYVSPGALLPSGCNMNITGDGVNTGPIFGETTWRCIDTGYYKTTS
jgi:prepilin-type N-terminal cleavage/methylation domain-containing protein